MSKKETIVEVKSSVKFEDALKRLEKIVEKLEAGEASLDESLSLYEEGIALFRGCQGKLEEAKKKVEILTKKSSGKLEAVAFKSGVEEAAAAAMEDDEEEKEELPF